MKTFLIPVWSARKQSAFYVSVLKSKRIIKIEMETTFENSQLVGFFKCDGSKCDLCLHRLKCRKGLSKELHNKRLKMPIHSLCETDNLKRKLLQRRNIFCVIVKLFPLHEKVLDYLRAVKIYGLISFNWYGNNELLHAISVSSDNYRFFGNQFFAHKTTKEKLKFYNSTLFGAGGKRRAKCHMKPQKRR